MKRAILALAILLCAVAPARADDHYGIGPIKAAMSYDEVRAATPGVVWKNLPLRGIGAEQAFILGGVAFDVQYVQEPWDRYRILAYHAAPLTDVAGCRQQYEQVAAAAQASLGNLQAPPPFADSEIGFQAKQEEIKIGGGSALLVRHVDPSKPESDWPFEASASWKDGVTTVNVNAEVHAASADKPAACVQRVTLSEYARRPRKGAVAFDTLVFLSVPNISRLHHSLDGVTPPAQGFDVVFDCAVNDMDGHLEACTPDKHNDPAAAPYLDAARERLSDYRVADRTREGKWTAGESTQAHVRIAPEDRHNVLTVDASKQSLLIFVAQPRAEEMVRFYPRDALDAGVGAQIEVGCVVQSDLSAICPEISVPAGPYQTQFRQAAEQIVTLYRVAPALSNGQSAIGVGFRMPLKLSP